MSTSAAHFQHIHREVLRLYSRDRRDLESSGQLDALALLRGRYEALFGWYDAYLNGRKERFRGLKLETDHASAQREVQRQDNEFFCEHERQVMEFATVTDPNAFYQAALRREDVPGAFEIPIAKTGADYVRMKMAELFNGAK